jgi:hypothetical protein
MGTITYNRVRDALLKKQQIVAEYDGHVREMCPHVIGRKNGREQALFYQFAGTSSSGEIIPGSKKNWRCIPINGLRVIEIKDGVWHTSIEHTQKQTCVDDIDVKANP